MLILDNVLFLELAEGGSLYDRMYVKGYKPTLQNCQQWANEIAQGKLFQSPNQAYISLMIFSMLSLHCAGV